MLAGVNHNGALVVSGFERIYPYLPVWAQNVGLSAYGLLYRRERLGGNFKQYAAAFRERDRWPAERMTTFLEQRLRHVLVHAFLEAPYYGRQWSAAGLEVGDLNSLGIEDLVRLPVTSKADVRACPDDFIARDVPRSRLHAYYTSGSTGTPIACYYTAASHSMFTAAREVRSFGWAGVSLRSPRAMIGGRMVVPRADSGPPYYRYNAAERQVYFSAYHISPQRAADYVRGFNRYRPKVLTGYAYSYYVLARIMLEQGLRLHYKPAALVLSSERLTSAMKEIILEAFHARPYEEYGSVEQVALATECECGSLHVNSDFGLIEIIDAEGRPVEPEREGRIVCTGLLNDAQPLVRYDLGDIGVWSATACSCGRSHLPVLKQLVGRVEDAVVCKDGRELVRFHGLFVNVPHVIEAQVIQETNDFLRVQVVTAQGFSEKEENLIYKRTIERTGPMRVKIDRVDEIKRNERGKFRAVVSRLAHHN